MGSELEIDIALIEQTKAGNAEAFDALFARHSNHVLEMLRLRCGGDEEIAKDLMQEAFIRAFVSIDKFDTRYTFGGWIYTIARNLHIDLKRRNKKQEQQQQEIDFETPCGQPNPEQHIINTQNSMRIDAAVSRMAEHYRIVFDMRYMQDLSYEDISQRLKLPLGTVKTQIHRARERFLRELGVLSFE